MDSTKPLSKWHSSAFILFAVIGCIANFSNAADMTITNISPLANATEICYDTKLWITFATAPIVSTDPNMHLYICKLSDDSIVYDLQLHTLPTNSYGPIATGWPYKITLAGKEINYQPFVVNGNVLEIYPSTTLEYNTTYYVKMTGGFCKDASNNTSPEINDNITWRFTTKAYAPTADHDYTITLDNTGDFCTLQGAINAVADNDNARTIIRLKNNTYRGCVHIPASKKNVTLLGESRDSAIIAGYNRELFNSGTNARAVILSYAAGLRLYNLTVHNTAPDNSGQAETITQSGLKCKIENCNFKSFQDTLLSNGQAYFKNSYIEGDTDYIWGTGTVYFDKCQAKFLTSGCYLTQPRASALTSNGLFFVDCAFTGDPNVSGCYLGRLFNPYNFAQTAIINCTMPDTLIAAAGWYNKDQIDMNNLRLWEYKSTTPLGVPLYTGRRLTPGSRQLTDAEAIYWRDVNNVFQYNPWNPKIATNLPTAAWSPHPTEGETGVATGQLTWSPGADVSSHMIYFGTANPPPFIAEVSDTSYILDQFIYSATTYYWRVDEKNSVGVTTGPLWSFVTSPTLDSTPPSPDPMEWSLEPEAVSKSSITMTATTATDDSGVEYKFINVTDTNHSTQWQAGPTFTDTGLENNKVYTYKVIARDKSLNHNQTAYSAEVSAQTDQYSCTSEIMSDLNGDCQVNFEDFSLLAEIWLQSRTTPERLINGTFDADLSNWTLADASSPSGVMTMAFDPLNGLPAGSALIAADTNNGATVNNHRFYQSIPVIVGNNYKLTGKWRGSLNDLHATNKRNWIEAFLDFSPNAVPSTWGNVIVYRKRFFAQGSGSNINFPPTSNGSFDWEDLSLSPNYSPVPPATAVWTATQPYMVVSFNIGGNIGSGSIWVDLDNISIVECPSPDADLNKDCQINMKDLAVAAADWLICHRDPSDECWH
jgi:hypothetical protein